MTSLLQETYIRVIFDAEKAIEGLDSMPERATALRVRFDKSAIGLLRTLAKTHSGMMGDNLLICLKDFLIIEPMIDDYALVTARHPDVWQGYCQWKKTLRNWGYRPDEVIQFTFAYYKSIAGL